MSKTVCLDVQGVTKLFGGLRANDDVHFRVEEGEIVSVIGPNGAGKSTLFNCITGFTSRTPVMSFFSAETSRACAQTRCAG